MMDVVTWDEKMSVGVTVLDDDHKRLLDMFASLIRADDDAPKSKDDLSRLLGGLHEYTVVHFGREEEMMERHGYPDLDSHRTAHRYFTDEVKKLHHEFDSSDEMMLRIDIILLLKEWLVEHIQSVDKQYTPYMAGTGAGAG